MNIVKWLPIALLTLPLMELAALIVVIVTFGLLWAIAAQALSSLVGLAVLRHAGGTHVSRVRAAFGDGSINALSADGRGSLTLFAGILMLVPGFITDVGGLLLLAAAPFLGTGRRAADDGIIDLAPEQWHQVNDREIADRRRGDAEH